MITVLFVIRKNILFRDLFLFDIFVVRIRTDVRDFSNLSNDIKHVVKAIVT